MSCSVSLNQLPGAKDCRNGNPYNMVSGIILTSEDQNFATYALAGDNANWETDIIADKIFVIPLVKNAEDASKEANVQEFDSGDDVETRASRRGFKAYFNLPFDSHKTLRKYSGNFKKFYFYDEKGNIFGTSPDGTGFYPLSISKLQVHEINIGLAGSKPLSSLTILEQFSSELDDDGHVIQPYKQGDASDRWFPSELPTVAKVTVTQSGTISANAFIVDVAYKSTSETDANGDPVVTNAIEGLVAANFSVLDGTGSVLTPVAETGVVESSTVPGRYTLTFAAMTAGSVKVVASTDAFVTSDRLTLT